MRRYRTSRAGFPLEADMLTTRPRRANGVSDGLNCESTVSGSPSVKYVFSSIVHELLINIGIQGKDDEFLCSLSVFDAYIVTRIHKSTKQFTFAVKSTDPISLFENKSDYLHVFSVPEETGVAWVEAIWLARVCCHFFLLSSFDVDSTFVIMKSYILHQERHVLSRNKAPGDASGTTGGALARSGTRKKPVQTYVSLSPTGPTAQASPFEPGSLLGKRI